MDGAVADVAAIAPLLAPTCEVVRVERGCDPLEVIADAVAARPGVRALHVFCHGEPGALRFGDSRLDGEALRRGAGRLTRIRAALEGGDILLYGCRVGGEAAGRDFVGHLSALTGASVAAATGLVGAAALGGSWALSEVRGTPKTAPIALPAFVGVLASGILQNRYVRFGYSDDGTLGYGGNTRPGIQYDPDGTRNFLDTADSLTPGTPFEGFTIAIGGTQYRENNSVSGGAATNGTHIVSTDLTTEGADTWGSVTYVTEVGGLRITQTLTLDGVDAKAITVSVTVENISGAAISDVTYARYLDPDVDSNGLAGSTPNTINVRGAGDIAPEDVVLATGPVSGRVIGYYSDSSVTHNTSVSAGWSTNPVDYLAGTDGSGSADHVIGIGFDLGNLDAGESVSFSIDMAFAASVEDLNESIPAVPPELGGTLSPVAAQEQIAALIAPALTVSDADSTTLASATVAITGGFAAGEDTLTFTNAAGMGNITGTYDSATGILSLSSAGATATLAEWQAALRAVTYTNTSDAPETADRTIAIVVNDGLASSAALTGTVSVTPINDAPAGAPAATLPVGAEDAPYLILASDLLSGISDPEGDALSISTLTASAGTLVDNLDGTWTLTPGAGFSGPIALTYAVSDGNGGTLPAQTRSLTINPAVPPELGGPLSPVAAQEQVAALIAPALTVSDADSTTLASATVAITGGFIAGEDTLAFANAAGMGNIAGIYDSATGILSLSSAGATATLAEWQTALRAVTYTNTSDTPDTADRTISIVANDALVPSAAFTATLSITALNEAPTGAPATDLPDGTAGTAYLITAADLLAGFADPDGGTLSVAGLSASAGTLVDNGDGTWTLTTAADFGGTVTLSYAVSDGNGATLPGQTRALEFAPAAESPPTAVPDTFTLVQNAPGIALDVLANDAGGDPASRRITHINDTAVTVGQMVAVAGGTLLLSVAGSIVFTPAAGFAGDVAFTYSFTDATGGASTGTVTGSVAPLEDLPQAAADHFTLPADGSPVTIDVVANDSHPGGTALTITQVEGRAIAAGESVSVRGGEVLLGDQNALVFTADPEFSGPVSFTYTAVDSQGRAADAIVTTTSAMAALAPELEAALTAAGLPRVSYLDDLLAIASVVAPGAFSALGAGLGRGYSTGPGTDLDLDSAITDADLMMQALLAIVGVQTSGTGQKVLSADDSGAWTSAINQSLLFQSVLSSDSEVQLAFGADGADFASPGSSMGAWSRSFAQQMLSADVSADYVTQADRQSQAQSHQSDVAAGSLLSVDIAGQSAGTPQAALSNLYGFVDFVSSDGQSAVEVSRTVMVAQTAGAGDQNATVTLRQTGMNDVEIAFYRVDDYSGTVDGLRPGEAGYDAASAARAYQTSGGDSWIAGGGYGELSTAELVGINSGDLIVMRLRSEGSDFYSFAQANETVNGEHVNHLWNYGLNTWGWEDLYGGGDQDFNDLVVRLDFVPSPDGLAG